MQVFFFLLFDASPFQPVSPLLRDAEGSVLLDARAADGVCCSTPTKDFFLSFEPIQSDPAARRQFKGTASALGIGKLRRRND